MLAFFQRATAFVDRAGELSQAGRDWLLAVVTALNQAPLRKQIATAAAQTAAIAATAVDLGAVVPGGYYRVSVYLRLTRAATATSSVTPTIGWTDENSQARTVSGTAYTGNVLTGAAPPLSAVIRIAANTAIEYSVAYASVGATSARYDVTVFVEQIPEMPEL